MNHRAEIDGLRALAVLPVILFHAGFEWFSGGFVGVDVFFVISGYLITTIIISEMAEGKFSIVNFYERRARRILPALFLVMLVCLPFAWFWLTPKAFRDFGQSLAAVSTFSSNILFLLESGYFDTAAELKPLLHTWSIAVEEQYYILFPAFLLLTWGLGVKRVLALLAILFVISLGAAHWGAFNKPQPTFYLLSTRAWELLIGIFVAFYLKHNGYLKSNSMNHVLSLIGCGLIVYSIVVFDEGTPFPSLYALVPTVGTGLIILSAIPGTIVQKVLSFAPIAGVGLVSYSAYLWHQPILAFARHRSFGEPSDLLLTILCLSSLALAYISWRWVEKPFRRNKKISQKAIFLYSFLGILFFTATSLGIKIHVLKGANIYGVPHFADSIFHNTQAKNSSIDCSDRLVLTGDAVCAKYGSGALSLIFWGDSHNAVLRDSYQFFPHNNGHTIYFIHHTGCPPAVGIRRYDKLDHSKSCDLVNFSDGIINFINIVKPKKLVLAGGWTLYIHGLNANNRFGSATHFITSQPGDGIASTPFDNSKLLESSFIKIGQLVPESVDKVIVNQPPDYLFTNRLMHYKTNKVPFGSFSKVFMHQNNILKNLGTNYHYSIIELADVVCDEMFCKVATGNENFYTDGSHLSTYGGVQALRVIFEKLQL